MKVSVPRTCYYPAGAQRVASKKSPAVVFLFNSAKGKPRAVGFYGKAEKPGIDYVFGNAERRMAYVRDWMKGCDERAARRDAERAAQKALRAKPQTFLQVGDILRSSWGYDQTNIDYYQVTKLVGKWMVEIREIGRESVDTEFMQGKCVPMKDSFTDDKAKRCVVGDNGSLKVSSCAYAYKLEPLKVDGKAVGYAPDHWTAYA